MSNYTKGILYDNKKDKYVIPYVPNATDEEVGLVKPDGVTTFIKDGAISSYSTTHSLDLFDVILKDHDLSFAEKRGLEKLGSYVYKNPVYNSRYGYPEFYSKCLNEYKASTKVYKKFVQPVLTEDGTIGGNRFAVKASSNYTTYYPFCAFDGNPLTSWQDNGTKLDTTYYIFYNPSALKVSKISYSGSCTYGYITSGNVYGSNDNSNWEQIGTWDGGNVGDIDLSNNTKFFKYHKITPLKWTDSSGTFTNGFAELKIEAVEEVTIYTNPNGHNFYDIKDKEFIDASYEDVRIAWYYGIDEENERIFLPRNDYLFNDSGRVDGEAYMVVGNTSEITHITTLLKDDDLLEQINSNTSNIKDLQQAVNNNSKNISDLENKKADKEYVDEAVNNIGSSLPIGALVQFPETAQSIGDGEWYRCNTGYHLSGESSDLWSLYQKHLQNEDFLITLYPMYRTNISGEGAVLWTTDKDVCTKINADMNTVYRKTMNGISLVVGSNISDDEYPYINIQEEVRMVAGTITSASGFYDGDYYVKTSEAIKLNKKQLWLQRVLYDWKHIMPLCFSENISTHSDWLDLYHLSTSTTEKTIDTSKITISDNMWQTKGSGYLYVLTFNLSGKYEQASIGGYYYRDTSIIYYPSYISFDWISPSKFVDTNDIFASYQNLILQTNGSGVLYYYAAGYTSSSSLAWRKSKVSTGITLEPNQKYHFDVEADGKTLTIDVYAYADDGVSYKKEDSYSVAFSYWLYDYRGKRGIWCYNYSNTQGMLDLKSIKIGATTTDGNFTLYPYTLYSTTSTMECETYHFVEVDVGYTTSVSANTIYLPNTNDCTYIKVK